MLLTAALLSFTLGAPSPPPLESPSEATSVLLRQAAGLPGVARRSHGPHYRITYFGARYYSALQGRFISPDAPFADQFVENPQSWNLYSYVRNRPLNLVDRDGRQSGAAPTWQSACQLGAEACQAEMKAMDQASKEIGKGAQNWVYNNLVSIPNLITRLSSVPDYVKKEALTIAPSEGQTPTEILTEASLNIALVLAPVALARGAGMLGAADDAIRTGGTEATQLFRAVGSAEAEGLSATRAFAPSPTGSEFKGFFFAQADAQSFAGRMTQLTGDAHSVVSATAPRALVQASPVHSAATEGPGVLIRNEDLVNVLLQ